MDPYITWIRWDEVPFSTKCMSFGVLSLDSTDSPVSSENIVLVTILKISSNTVLLDPN
jgi:hypothetical protein